MTIDPSMTISPEASTLLPDVLVDYLWRLALSGEHRSAPVQTFVLTSGVLGGRSLQEITHLQLDETRRVFGFAPVSCRLYVLNSSEHYRMILTNQTEKE